MGKHLYEYLGQPGPLTHREHMTWLAWEQLQWNRPSRSDYYQMQTAFEICRSNAAKPKKIQFEWFVMKFKDPTGVERQLKATQGTIAASKAAWINRMTKPVQRVKSEGE